MKRKRRIVSPEAKKLGREYAAELRLRAQLMRSCFLLSRKARELIARDLEALAYMAEKRPECFRRKTPLTSSPQPSLMPQHTPTQGDTEKGIEHEGRAKGRQGRDGGRRR